MEYLFFVLFLYTFRKIVMELILILIFILACILVFISKNIILIGVGILVTIGILVGIRLFTDYLKYKDETSEQRAERLKTEEMIKEWQKRYY